MKRKMTKTMTGIMAAAMLIPTFAGVSASAAKNIAISKKNFPDKNFRKQISKNYDKNHDKKLSPKEIKSVKNMCFDKVKFKNIKGISYFNNLEKFSIINSSLGNVDFGKFKKLKEIDLSHNTVKSVNISKCSNLEKFTVNYSKLKKIDVSANKKLKELDLNYNFLTGINLSENRKLEELHLDYNSLSELDVRNNSLLNKLTAQYNIISDVKFEKNDKLEELDLSYNNISAIDLSEAQNILDLDLTDNYLKSIDLSRTPKIKKLSLIANELVEIDTTVLKDLSTDNFYASSQRAYAVANENGQYTLADYPVNHIENLKISSNYEDAKPILEYAVPLFGDTRKNYESFLYKDAKGAELKGNFINSTPISWKKTEADKKKVSLEWNEIAGAESYTVVRVDLAEGSTRKFENISGSTYTNTKAESGSAYIYYIEGDVGGAFDGSLSTRVAVTAK